MENLLVVNFGTETLEALKAQTEALNALTEAVKTGAPAKAARKSKKSAKKEAEEPAAAPAVPVEPVAKPVAKPVANPVEPAAEPKEKKVSLEDITAKASDLLDADKMDALCELLEQFKCEAITELPADQYADFYKKLCAIPA